MMTIQRSGKWRAAALVTQCLCVAGCRSPSTGGSVGRVDGSVRANLVDVASESPEREPQSPLQLPRRNNPLRLVSMEAPDDPREMQPEQPGWEGPQFVEATLTLAELQSLAVSYNPTLRQAQALLQQAQGNWLQSGLYPNPVLGYSGSANNAPFDAQQGYLSQNIVTAHKLALNRDVAAYDQQRAQWDVDAQCLRVANDVHIRYIEALGAQKRLVEAEEILQLADQGVRTAEKMLEAETVSRADVLQARLQRNQTLLLVQNARVQADTAWKHLMMLVGRPDMPRHKLEGSLEGELPQVDREVAWQELLSRSPELHSARARMSAAAMQIERERVQKIPDIQLNGMAGRDVISNGFMMYGLQVGVALPIFDKNEGNILAACGEYRAAQAEVQRLELSLKDRLVLALQRFQTALNEVVSYRDSIIPTAEENLKLTLAGYEGGEFDFLRVLTARRDLFAANLAYVSSLTEMQVALVEIQGMLLTGGLDAVDARPTAANQSGATSGPGR